MNIIILSNIGNRLDEGNRNVSNYLFKQFSKRHCIYHVNAKKNIFSISFWRTLTKLDVDIIHIFLRPDVKTFLYIGILKIVCRHAKIVISSLQPPLNFYLVKMILTSMPFLKPELVLVLTRNSKRIFSRLGLKTAFLSCGVDTQKFRPVSKEKKLFLRQKYKISKDKFVILHVGPVSKERNLLQLRDLQKEPNNQILIVSSTTSTSSKKLSNDLKIHGCIVLQRYFEHIEEIYQLSDCYIFPALDTSSCIELPLSVLEAMSCNLPVITMKFGAIPRLFEEGEGLIFIDNEDDIKTALKRIKSGTLSVRTRKKVAEYTWERASLDLERLYKGLL